MKQKKKQKEHKLVLALGEGSHTHIMTSKKEIDAKIVGDQIDFILKDLGIITHEEHDRIVLPAGKYQKFAQQEYDPFARKFRAVFD